MGRKCIVRSVLDVCLQYLPCRIFGIVGLWRGSLGLGGCVSSIVCIKVVGVFPSIIRRVPGIRTCEMVVLVVLELSRVVCR
jgi:hypothetical protein